MQEISQGDDTKILLTTHAPAVGCCPRAQPAAFCFGTEAVWMKGMDWGTPSGEPQEDGRFHKSGAIT